MPPLQDGCVKPKIWMCRESPHPQQEMLVSIPKLEKSLDTGNVN